MESRKGVVSVSQAIKKPGRSNDLAIRLSSLQALSVSISA